MDQARVCELIAADSAKPEGENKGASKEEDVAEDRYCSGLALHNPAQQYFTEDEA